MRIRRSLLWLCLAFSSLIVLLIWVGKGPVDPVSSPLMETVPESEAKMEQAQTGSSQHESRRSSGTNAPESAAVDRTSPPPPATGTKSEQMQQGLAALNDEEVVFYGRVLDQFDLPVAGAAISGSIQVNNGTRVGTDRLSLTSDENGRFTISGYKGKTLGFGVSKPGYVLATAKTSFVYSLLWSEAERHSPDPNNPTVIRMWKLQGAEPLVRIGKQFRLPFTEAPLVFDLIKGELVERGGDLELSITRSPGALSKKNPGDWSIVLKPRNGGIIESEHHAARITFEAPADGYQDNYLVRMNHENRAWFDSINKVFFLKTRSGHVYSKITFDFRINNEPTGLMWFQFKGVANTNGSRNWEATAPPQ